MVEKGSAPRSAFLFEALLGCVHAFNSTAPDEVDDVMELGPCLLNVVVAQSSAIFELLAGKDQALLIGWDAFLVLDLGFDIVDRVARLNLKGYGLARESLDEATED